MFLQKKCLIKNFNFMKNLENYGVLEMNTKEMKETDGGIIMSFLFGKYVGGHIVDYIEAKYNQGCNCN